MLISQLIIHSFIHSFIYQPELELASYRFTTEIFPVSYHYKHCHNRLIDQSTSYLAFLDDWHEQILALTGPINKKCLQTRLQEALSVWPLLNNVGTSAKS